MSRPEQAAALPVWLAEEAARRAEADRLARRAAYDQWAADYYADIPQKKAAAS